VISPCWALAPGSCWEPYAAVSSEEHKQAMVATQVPDQTGALIVTRRR
jgi:hypothetical protein